MAQADFDTSTVADEPESRPGGIPLYVWVIGAAVIAVPLGMYFHGSSQGKAIATQLEILPKLIIRALTALATPLVFLAIIHAIVTNDIRGRQGGLMMVYYLINTIVAIAIGLFLSNLIHPGSGANLAALSNSLDKKPKPLPEPKTVTDLVYELVPTSIADSFARNHLTQLVLVALALGIGLAKIRDFQRARAETSHQVLIDLVTVSFELLMKVLLWVVALVPLAVFGVVAAEIMYNGLAIFQSLGWFILVVIGGLACQITWYLIQLLLFARMSPLTFLRGASSVMITSFSTASTTATIPVTLKALMGPLRVSRPSSQLAACVGTNFNNDGTALYQAAVVLFIAQALGRGMNMTDQIVIVLTTVVASVGAGGIPSGSFITLPLIFAAVALPPEQIPILLTVDWFLDRCRTCSNVLGDMTVAVLLDKTAAKEKPVVAGVLD
jgi:DAACS family dicarboxylate/amino acid:cation (Na+ or H+) symporter